MLRPRPSNINPIAPSTIPYRYYRQTKEPQTNSTTHTHTNRKKFGTILKYGEHPGLAVRDARGWSLRPVLRGLSRLSKLIRHKLIRYTLPHSRARLFGWPGTWLQPISANIPTAVISKPRTSITHSSPYPTHSHTRLTKSGISKPRHLSKPWRAGLSQDVWGNIRESAY